MEIQREWVPYWCWESTVARFLVKFDFNVYIKFILVQSCQTHKRQFNAMTPLYLEGGSFVSLGIHIAQKSQQRTKEKKKKIKDKWSQIHREEEKKRYVYDGPKQSGFLGK